MLFWYNVKGLTLAKMYKDSLEIKHLDQALRSSKLSQIWEYTIESDMV